MDDLWWCFDTLGKYDVIFPRWEQIVQLACLMLTVEDFLLFFFFFKWPCESPFWKENTQWGSGILKTKREWKDYKSNLNRKNIVSWCSIPLLVLKTLKYCLWTSWAIMAHRATRRQDTECSNSTTTILSFQWITAIVLLLCITAGGGGCLFLSAF